MSDMSELRRQLLQIEEKWNDERISSPHELASLIKQRRELKKRILELMS